MIVLPKKRLTLSRNSHLPKRTNTIIDAVTPIIQQQNHNALQAAGYPIYIYKKFSCGDKCPCSKNRGEVTYDMETGLATESQMNNILKEAQVSIQPYNAAGQEVIQNINTPAANLDTMNIIGEENLEMPLDMTLSGLGMGGCPVCLGTGYKGGYTCLQGNRQVFDYSDLSDYDGIEIDKASYPSVIRLSLPESYIEIKTIVPKVALNKSPVLRLLSMSEQLQFKAVIIDNEGAYTLTNGFRNSGECRIRVYGKNIHGYEFPIAVTHMELMIPTVSKPEYADIPNLINNFDALKVYPYSPTTITVSPHVPTLKAWDVIIDIQHKLRWLVTSSKPVYASNNKIWTQECEVRCIEPYELTHMLIIPTETWINCSVNYGLESSTLPVPRRGGY